MPSAVTAKLAHFSVVAEGRGFRLHVEDEEGEMLDLSATYDQIELIADALDDLLATDDSDDEEGDDEGDDDDKDDDNDD
jgi:hypothetical protein